MPSWQSKVLRRGFETGRRQLYGDLTDLPALRARLDRLSAPLARWSGLAYEPVEGALLRAPKGPHYEGARMPPMPTAPDPAGGFVPRGDALPRAPKGPHYEGARMPPVPIAPVPAEWVYPNQESVGRKGRSPPALHPQRGASVERAPRDDILAQRTVVYLHGGGYCVGSIVTHRVLAGDVARACQARALVLDYRLAPEDPFPAAVEDSVVAYEWLLDQGTAPGQVVLAGDSAGGGLVLSTLVSLRDKGLPLPAAGICLSPWADLSLSGQSMVDNAKKDLVLTEEMLRTFARRYLREGDPCHPLASPLFADLAGLPPLLVQAGSHEILLDDARRVAERAQDAGVEVVLDVWEEMVHVWQAYAAFLPESREAIARIGEFVVGHCSGG